MENRVGEVENCFPLYTYLNELNIENNCRCVLVRVLLTWEARNFKRNKDLMNVDFLLLDERLWAGFCQQVSGQVIADCCFQKLLCISGTVCCSKKVAVNFSQIWVLSVLSRFTFCFPVELWPDLGSLEQFCERFFELFQAVL
ncbi:hypothetical protein ACS0TY_016816 [Phlomoides rotata]